MAADKDDGEASAGTAKAQRASAPSGPLRRVAVRDHAEGNARLTASIGAVLIVLLAAEGVTILRVHALLTVHVFVGALVIPPVLVKVGSTLYRFIRYYTGDPDFRRKGPPALLLRMLGPVVVVLTAVLFGTGVALMFVARAWRSNVLFLHKAGFVLWFGAMAVHVLGHLGETARTAPRDWFRPTARAVTGAGLRRWLLTSSLVAGIFLGIYLVGRVGWWSQVVALGAR